MASSSTRISNLSQIDWGHKIEGDPVAYLVHPSGNTAWMEFHIDGDNCYMTDGKIVSLLFGIKQPTEVILTYNEHNTTITMRNSSNEPENIIFPFQDNTYILHPYENDQLFGWEYKVTQAMASETKNQVLRIPPNTGKSILRGRNSITIKTQANLDGCRWTIHTYTRENGRKEISFTEGWYAFKRANNLAEGDKLQFQVSDPADVMTVEIVRANNSN
ncbi:hypothetical protein P8452_32180 [Trifolium repens]|nr:hypothetical protein P8452_32180 [Trifolium repens]